MTDTYPAWTEERVEELKKLWEQGHSAAIIARRIRMVSRSAVLGKLYRLGLSQPQQSTRKPNFRLPKKAKERDMEVVKVQQSKPAWQALPMPTERERPATLYTLTDRPDNGCMYFYGDPLKDNRGYCGKNREPGIAYCAECARICFDVRTPNERQKARAERERAFA